jgi:DNA-binding beta-propeller fold protein YncE
VIDLPTQSITDAVVSDTGSLLVASKNGDGTVAVQLVPASGAAQTLETMQAYGAMAFAPSADTAVLADAGASAVLVASQLSSKPVLTHFAGAAQGASSPRAAAVSADGQFAFIANGTGGTVLRLNLAGPPALKAIKCACSPTELIPLFGNATFQITDPAAGTIYALEGDTKEPRTVFIPTDKVAAAAGGGQ